MSIHEINGGERPQGQLSFLAGGGEMGERTRSFDWSQTAVGPAAAWPESLKIAVRIMLESRYAMWLGWGPELTFFYNDAYARITLGPKHPWALGRRADEVWSEIWPDVKPRVETVFCQGQATWDEGLLLFLERNGFPEETYHTFSYSPIPDERGAVGGMLCVVAEETERMIGERRLRTLRDLAARTSQEPQTVEDACRAAVDVLDGNRNDLPFALIYLRDERSGEFRFKAGFGIEPGSAAAPLTLRLGDSALSVWPLAEVARTRQLQVVENLVERFGRLECGVWPEPPQRAVVLPLLLPGQAEIAGMLVVGVSPRLMFGDSYRGFLELLAGQVTSAMANAAAYQQQRERAESLTELDRAKTAFFSNVSHEFRTPLTLMLGPVEDMLARSHTELTPAAKSQLEMVNRNGLRLLRLVNTLLDFSRIEAGRVRALYQATDLAAFTSELASVFRSACQRAGLRLEVDCRPLGEPVFVDRDMWEKVVLNLLSNAFKFTLVGEIAVTLRRAGGYAELRVRDTGIGIPADELPRIFERFHRVETAEGRTHEGSGIGLALVQELVKLHAGTIVAESVPGEGTTLAVRVPLGSSHLPAEQVGAADNAAATPTESNLFLAEALRWLPDEALLDDANDGDAETLAEPIEAPYPIRQETTGRPRVLVADDNADMRGYVARLLAPHCHVETVADGEAALAAIQDRVFDLLLTDVMMPRVDGFELLRQVRNDPRTSALPVIMLSARAGEESRVDGMAAGADDYVVKPFAARELLARVSAHLEMSRMRKEASESLRRGEERLQMALSAARMLVWQLDPATGEVVTSENAADMLGLPPGTRLETAEQGFALIHPDDLAEHRRVVTETLERQGSFVSQYRIIRPVDGRTMWVEARGHSASLGPGRNGLLGVLVDVTERHAIETAAHKSQERLRLLWDAAAVLLTTRDPDAMLHQLFARIGPHLKLDTYFNFMVNEAGTGLRLASCAGIPEESQRNLQTLEFGQAVCGTVAVVRHAIVATHIQQSSDPKVQLVKSLGLRAYACNPLLAGEELLGTLSFASRTRDEFAPDELDFLQTICQYVTAAYERLRLISKLQEADRRKDEFLATLAHELRNPLAPLRNGLQVMKIAADDTEAVEESRSMMERQLAQMVRLIDDLLDLSRISRGKVELRKQRIELVKAVNQAVETSRPAMEQAGHEFTISLPPGPLYVDADLTRLAQVFANLLNNAAKYTERGGHIRLSVERQGSDAVVSIRDNGMGIPAHMLPRVFDIFTQVDRSLEKSQGGLGIGLSLVKWLVDMHGGSVEANSEGLGYGSEFIVRLPCVRPSSDSSPTSIREPEMTGTKKRVLVVDDNRDAATSLAMMLRIMGNDARTAHDGLEALDVGGVFQPDVVLLDIGMPKLNGYDTARRIRELPWGERVVLVALTGWGQEEDRRKSQDAGFNHHMVKPIAVASLDKLLADAPAAAN